MRLRYLFLLLITLYAAQAKAQELPRRAYLGLRTTALPDSLAVGHQLRHGLLVTAAAAASTAQVLGIKPGDILLALNKKQLNQPEELTALSRALYPGQALTVQVLRDGKRKTLKAKAVARPLEQAAHAEVVYGQVPFLHGQLRTITYKPRKAGKYPAILFIPGFPCRSIDDYGGSSYDHLIKGWSDLGYMVMLVEKPGLGDNINTPDCMAIDLFTEIEAFEQGLLALRQLPEVDPENIFLFGHSMGGIIAPILSQKHAVKGVMVYGSPYRPWFEFVAEMYRFQGPVAGADYVAHEADVRQMYHVLYRFFVLRQHPDTIAAADPAYKKVLQGEFQHTGGDTFWSRHYRYWQQIDELNLTKAWAETEAYVLSIWGEHDFEVVNDEDHKRIVEVVNHYHPGKATLLVMPQTNHSLIRVPSMAEGVVQMRKRDTTYNRKHFNTKLVTDTDAWMRNLLKKQQTP